MMASQVANGESNGSIVVAICQRLDVCFEYIGMLAGRDEGSSSSISLGFVSTIPPTSGAATTGNDGKP